MHKLTIIVIRRNIDKVSSFPDLLHIYEREKLYCIVIREQFVLRLGLLGASRPSSF